MAEIYLVRHGEVAGNIASGPDARLLFSGWNDVPLTPRGHLQAATVGKYLQDENIAAVYSSDLARAMDTARPIAAAHHLQVLADKRWRELHFGIWSGLGERELLSDWAELWAKRQADPENVRAPDGENLRDLLNRVRPAWQEIVSRHTSENRNENVVIVAHQGVIRMLLMDIMQAPLPNYRSLRIGNGSVSRIVVENNQAVIHGISDVSHLKGI